MADEKKTRRELEIAGFNKFHHDHSFYPTLDIYTPEEEQIFIQSYNRAKREHEIQQEQKGQFDE